MKKYNYLGVNETIGAACHIRCLLPFEMLDKSNLEPDDFTHETMNYNGRDTIPRILSLNNLKETGRKLKLNKPLTFTGTYYETNRNNNYWAFEINEIRELIEV